MDRDPSAIALNNAITEINKAYPDIKNSFIFTKNGTVLTGDQETDQQTINNIQQSFENLKEKAKTIGNLENFTITTKNGKLTLSNIKDMHLLLATSKNADKNHIHSITQVIIPTILKTMEALAPTQPQITPPKQLIVDTLTGFFAGDSVQIDTEILKDWTKNSNDPRARVKAAITGEQSTPENIEQVKIETFGGNSTLCKVKEVNDQNMKGKNMIRIPEKLCKSLEINKGDMVKVEPAS
jgi:predicted regulator of Ras-like GTPase activity (Roadblock/LC7/MglB family)/translation initiation factor IF-1